MAVSAKTRYEVLRRDRYACRFCGGQAPDFVLHVDHVVPVSAGGTDEAANLQVLCEECNLGKYMTMPERWLVKETARRQARWHRGIEEECPDDLSDMYAYQDAFAELAALSAEHALSCVTHAMSVAYPYRPTATEAILAGAKMAAEGYGAESGMPF